MASHLLFEFLHVLLTGQRGMSRGKRNCDGVSLNLKGLSSIHM